MELIDCLIDWLKNCTCVVWVFVKVLAGVQNAKVGQRQEEVTSNKELFFAFSYDYEGKGKEKEKRQEKRSLNGER